MRGAIRAWPLLLLLLLVTTDLNKNPRCFEVHLHTTNGTTLGNQELLLPAPTPITPNYYQNYSTEKDFKRKSRFFEKIKGLFYNSNRIRKGKICVDKSVKLFYNNEITGAANCEIKRASSV